MLNAEKPQDRKDQIQFIHAADEEYYEEKSNQNELLSKSINEISELFKEWETVERTSRTVGLDEIQGNDYNLNIALYVDTTEPEEDIDVEQELVKLRELQAERADIEARMADHMEALDYE